MPDSELDKAKDIIKKEQEKHANALLSSVVDLQDSLTMVFEKNFKNTGECDGLVYANDSLVSFFDSKFKFIEAKPRSFSSKDKKVILPGQHAGVLLLFGLDDGTRLKINFYGGLRMFANEDLKDDDITLQRSHTTRTDKILSQDTYINWQIEFLGSQEKIDSWIKYSQRDGGSFSQYKLLNGEEAIDCSPSLGIDSPNFSKLMSEIFNPIKQLTKLVPSSV